MSLPNSSNPFTKNCVRNRNHMNVLNRAKYFYLKYEDQTFDPFTSISEFARISSVIYSQIFIIYIKIIYVVTVFRSVQFQSREHLHFRNDRKQSDKTGNSRYLQHLGGKSRNNRIQRRGISRNDFKIDGAYSNRLTAKMTAWPRSELKTHLRKFSPTSFLKFFKHFV